MLGDSPASTYLGATHHASEASDRPKHLLDGALSDLLTTSKGALITVSEPEVKKDNNDDNLMKSCATCCVNLLHFASPLVSSSYVDV